MLDSDSELFCAEFAKMHPEDVIFLEAHLNAANMIGAAHHVQEDLVVNIIQFSLLDWIRRSCFVCAHSTWHLSYWYYWYYCRCKIAQARKIRKLVRHEAKLMDADTNNGMHNVNSHYIDFNIDWIVTIFAMCDTALSHLPEQMCGGVASSYLSICLCARAYAHMNMCA